MVQIIAVMGVTGSGKTTVGTMLAVAMHCAYLKGSAALIRSRLQHRSGHYMKADMLEHRHPYGDFDAAFQHHGADEIKVVLEWAA